MGHTDAAVAQEVGDLVRIGCVFGHGCGITKMSCRPRAAPQSVELAHSAGCDPIGYPVLAMPSEPIGVSTILAKAAEVFGTAAAAQSWLIQPALGLDGQRPIDLLESESGAVVVADFLVRLDYNVYC